MNPKDNHHFEQQPPEKKVRTSFERFFFTCFQHIKILHNKMPAKACLFYVRSALVLCKRDIMALNAVFEVGYLG